MCKPSADFIDSGEPEPQKKEHKEALRCQAMV